MSDFEDGHTLLACEVLANRKAWRINCPNEAERAQKAVDKLKEKGYKVEHHDDGNYIVVVGNLHNVRVILGEVWDFPPEDIGAEYLESETKPIK